MDKAKVVIMVVVSIVLGLAAAGVSLTLTSTQASYDFTYRTVTPSTTAENPLATSAPEDGNIQLPPSGKNNCVFTLASWRDNPDAWPIQEFTIGEKPYKKAEMAQILSANSREFSNSLLQQLIVVEFNRIQGAEISSGMQEFIDQAKNWIIVHQEAEKIPYEDRQKALNLIEMLENFNKGKLGPRLCNFELKSALEITQQVIKMTERVIGTFTPSPTVTRTPTMTRIVRFSSITPTLTNIPPATQDKPRSRPTHQATQPPSSTEPPPPPPPTDPPPPPPPTDPPPPPPPTDPPPPPPPTDPPPPPPPPPPPDEEPTLVPTSG